MSKKGRPSPMDLTDDIPPGATPEAFEAEQDVPSGGPPGSGAGDRHMAGDTGPDLAAGPDGPTFEDFGYRDDDRDSDQSDEPDYYGGPSGGAVGGTPAGGRSTGGTLRGHEGIDPGGVHRGDSTIGAEPSKGKKR
jgi:hypothetical protein